MKAEERRKNIVGMLMASKAPISGSRLSAELGVSRQIIVQDISIIKASGYDILSTHTGYVMQESPLVERVFKVHHTAEQTEEELSCVTEPFYRTDKARSRADGGAGLGLALCKRIAESHGASLEFSSEMGKGTTVSVQLSEYKK